MPLFFEMARCAVERVRPEHLDTLRDLRAVVADARRDREERFEAGRQVLVLVSDMTGNRVWQMLARKVRDFLRSEPMRRTRHALRRDPGAIVPTIDRCLTALEPATEEGSGVGSCIAPRGGIEPAAPAAAATPGGRR